MPWRRVISFWVGLLAITAAVMATDFHFNSGDKITGELAAIDGNGFVIRLPDGTYTPRFPWLKLSDETLEALKDHPKAKKFVEPLILPPAEEVAVKEAKAAIKLSPPAMPAPVDARKGWLTAIMSPPGLLFLGLLYLANLYAAYEISRFKWRPAALVCGAAAVLPVIGPVLFVILPRYIAPVVEDATKAASADMKLAVADSGPSLVKQMGMARAGANQAVEEVTGGTRSFTRATHTFNRKFLEGQLGNFLKPVVGGEDAGMALEVVHARGTSRCQRIARLTMNDAVFLDEEGREIPVEYMDLKEIHVRPV